MSRSVLSSLARGAAWMVLLKFVERSLGLVSTLILVRVLSPADFGLVAMAVTCILMIELLTATNFDIVLISDPHAGEEHFNTAWTLSVLSGLLVMVILLGLARPVASFYKQPQVVDLISVLAFAPLISSFENIGVVAFRRELQFRQDFFFQLSKKLSGFLVAIPVALIFETYWALIAGTLSSRIATTLYSYRVHPFRPRFSLSRWRGILGVSKWLLLSNAIDFLKERASDFVIGRIHGPTSLGLYSVAHEVANLPTTELALPVNRALLPGYSKLASDRVAFERGYWSSMQLLAAVAIPAAMGILAISEFLVPLILGVKWIEATPMVQVLTFSGMLLVFQATVSSVLIATGHVDTVAKLNLVYVVALLTLVLVLVRQFGVLGAAFSSLVVSICTMPLYLIALDTRTGLGPGIFFRAILRPALAAAVMSLMLEWLTPVYTPADTTLHCAWWVVVGITIGVSSYAASLGLFWVLMGRPDGAERFLLDRVREQLRGQASESRA